MENYCKIRNITPLHSPQLLARCGHTITYHPLYDALYVYGGNTLVTSIVDGEKTNLSPTVFKYDFQSRQWEQLNCSGIAPLVRYHTCCAYKDSLLFFNGELNQLHLPSKQWKRIDASLRPRSFHSAVIYNDSMIVFGGRLGQFNNNVQIFDLIQSKWILVEREYKPKQRIKHAAVVVNDSMFILGGFGLSIYFEDYSIPLFDLNEFDIPSRTWREVNYKTTLCAEPTSVLVGDWVVGIENGKTVWAFHLIWRRWYKLRIGGNVPTLRDSYAVTERNGVLYLFGGLEPNYYMCSGGKKETYFLDLFELDLREATVKQGLLNTLQKHDLWDTMFIFRETSIFSKHKYIKLG